MQTSSTTSILRTWALYQSLGFSLGWLFHGIISHAFTGEHELALSFPQLIMHNVSLLGMAAIFLAFQHKACNALFGINLWKYGWLYLLIPTAMFWIGYYCIGMPIDLVFSFLSFSLLNGIIITRNLKLKWWTMLSLLSAVTGIVVGTVIITCIEPALVGNTNGVIKHTIIFFIEGSAVGVPMAFAGGWLLKRSVIKQMKISM